MDKSLQDLAWSLLPKEFKEEVKNKWEATECGSYAEGLLESIFGLDNLASDAKGEEETLYVSRKQVQEMYSAFEEFKDKDNTCFNLETLFGSKCLPDNVDSLSQNSPENCNNGNLISSDDNKPAEPKFKVGQFAMYKGRRVEIIGHSDHSPQLYRVFVLTENYHTDADESDLEPYTEPDTSHETPLCENHSDNTSQKEVNVNSNRNLSQEAANCDKELDNILKDSFSKERRLNIAATILAGIMAGGAQARRPVRRALELADALIIESEKGGVDGK